MSSVQEFYDQLAADYHTIFADWQRSVKQQGDVLDRLIQAHLPTRTVLDCTCGIGTQAIGLALKGYRVHATDLSPTAVERAQREAESIGAELTFGVADLRTLRENVQGEFNVVLSCDNSLAHFLTDADMQLTLDNMRAMLAPGGLLLASLRDYDWLLQEKPRSTTPQVSERADRRQISFQVWDWLGNGCTYTLNHFTLKQNGTEWETSCRVTQLRAWRRAEITLLLRQAGLTDIQWHMPVDSGYYQPIVTARRT
jgi:glycine/sarcosine N-methyltransferase